LISRHATIVIATARRILVDPHRAEDVAQTVFIQLAHRAGELTENHPVAGWLYLEARHRSLDLRRSDTRRLVREHSAAMHLEEPHSKVHDLTEDLESVLDELEPEERDALVLRYLEDRQLAEVGQELGVSEQAA
jgi:RNA polymerase sigma factor (sigma-70 family)